jgi:DNA-directed RNA polymerase beta subunit
MKNKNKTNQNLEKLNPNYFLAHHKQSFRFFLTKKIQEAFHFINILFSQKIYNINFIFFSKYIYFKEISYSDFLRTLTYGYYVYVPVYMIFFDSQGNIDKKLEWFCCGLLPGMTQNSSFIIRGITRSVFTQLIRKQGLMFQKPQKKFKIQYLMELRTKKSKDTISLRKKTSKYLFCKYFTGEVWILIKNLKIQLPGPLFLKALNISSKLIVDLFPREKFPEYILPDTVEQARILLYFFFLNSIQKEKPKTRKQKEWKKNEMKKLNLFIKKFFNQTYDINSLIEEANDFFFHLLWNKDQRYCDQDLRFQLLEQCGSPFNIEILNLQVLDIYFLMKKLLYHESKQDEIDHLLNKNIRSCGDFLYLHTIEGLYRFIKKLEKIEIRIDQKKKVKGLDEEIMEFTDNFFLKMDKLEKMTPESKQETIKIMKKKQEEKNFQKQKEEEKNDDDDELFLSESFAYFLSTEWKAFFISGTLSQYGQNLNPLSLLTHSRRLTSLGFDGLDKDLSSVDVRNIHTTSFGHFCPIETPEGKNVGLIHSFALFTWCQQTSKKNSSYLFKEFATPFYYVYKNQVQKEHPLMLTIQGQEKNFQKNSVISADITENRWLYMNKYNLGFSSHLPNMAIGWSFENYFFQEMNFKYFSPYQIISAVTGLIPFLEHNDANRSLMASNMQRQAVNLLHPHLSKIKTGLEIRSLSDINHNFYSPKTGYVSNKNKNSFSLYTKNLEKTHILFNSHQKTNEYTYSSYQIRQNQEKWLQKGDFCGEYGSSKQGKLALGQNLFVGYLPWYGWNYEDAIILNEKCLPLFTGLEYIELSFLPKYLTSIDLNFQTRLQKAALNKEVALEICVQGFKLFQFINQKTLKSFADLVFEEKVGENEKHYPKLYPGLWVKEGDCLYGKCVIFLSYQRPLYIQYLELEIILKDTFPSFDHFYNYLHGFLFFGEDSSNSRAIQKDKDSLLLKKYIQKAQKAKKTFTKKEIQQIKKKIQERNKIQEKTIQNFVNLKKNKKFLEYSEFFQAYLNIKRVLFQSQNTQKVLQTRCRIENTSIYASKKFEGFIASREESLFFQSFNESFLSKYQGNLLNQEKIEIIQKTLLEIGDKLSGRHGNKGIFSKINANENMPYFLNGKSLDIVLNPLGIPSRMNLGQLYECFLGFAGYFLNESYTLSIFDERFGANASRSYVYSKLFETAIKQNNDWFFSSDFPGKSYVFDGTTGEYYKHPISLGFTSILKLIHMVDKKLYARTLGAYSALSKQPVRGRSLQGGQRLGEMEIWALQGYGAAFVLQEVYFVKSGHLYNRSIADSFFLRMNSYANQDFFSIDSFLFLEAETFSPLKTELNTLFFNT